MAINASKMEMIQNLTMTFRLRPTLQLEVMMQRRHFKIRFPHGHLEITDLKNDREGFHNKYPADNGRRISCLVMTAIVTNAPPRDKDPTSPMNTSAG
jgi:hypothetical protein